MNSSHLPSKRRRRNNKNNCIDNTNTSLVTSNNAPIRSLKPHARNFNVVG